MCKTIDKSALAVAKLAAKDKSRPVLNMVAIRNGFAYAADGFSCARAPLNSVTEIVGPEVEGDVLIPKELAEQIARNAEPVMNDANGKAIGPGVAWVAGERTVAWKQMGATTTVDLKAFDGTYPDIDKLIEGWEGREHAVTLAVNVDIMSQALAAAKTFLGGENNGIIRFKVGEKQQPMLMEATKHDGRTMVMAVMPMVVRE